MFSARSEWFGVMSDLEKFTSLTVFVLAYRETSILRQTVDGVLAEVEDEDLEKVVVVLKDRECPSSIEMKKGFSNPKVETYIQKSPNIELCIAEIPALVKSSHFIIMTADMEMNPKSIRHMIAEAKKHPQAIVCATKWHKDSVVENYGFIHKLCTRTLNTVVSVILGRKIKDAVTFFQVYPAAVYRKMKFDWSKNVVFELTSRPVRAGVDYIEIPTVYKRRAEGKSSFDVVVLVIGAIRFVLAAIRVRLRSLHRK